MQTAIKPPRQRHVTIQVDLVRAIIPPHVKDIVKAALTPRSNKFKYRKRESLADLQLLELREPEGWMIPVGLVPRIACLLVRAGYSVEVEHKYREELTPDELGGRTEFDFSNSFNCRAITAAMKYARGHFRVDRVADILPLAIDLVRLFASSKILVVVKNNEAAQEATAMIETYVDVPVTAAPDYVPCKAPHIHVDCLASFKGRNVYNWDVVIVADGNAAVSLTAVEQATCMLYARIYSIIPRGQHLDAEDQLRVEALSGPDRCPRQPYAEHFTAVEVIEVGSGGYPPHRRRNPLERKRVNIWHHAIRNQRVAEFGLALRCLDPYKLRALGIDGSTTVQAFRAAGLTPRVAVVVEVPEHARALRRLLPGWAALDLNNTPNQAERWVECEQTIITRSRARRADIVADVILRATGVEESWDNRYGPFMRLNEPNMLVIDFMDDFDREAAKASRLRSQEYQELGW